MNMVFADTSFYLALLNPRDEWNVQAQEAHRMVEDIPLTSAPQVTICLYGIQNIMTILPTLETKRLVLRPFSLSDAKDVQRLAGDWAVADTTARIPHPYEDGLAEEWISCHEAEFRKGKCVNFAIALKSEGAFIGAIALMDIAKDHKAELGYWIGKPYWNMGYCTEAAGNVVRYAFETLQLKRVTSHHLSRNPASGRVMQKVGMSHEGTRRAEMLKWGKLEDVELYGILASDWAERPGKT